MAAHTYAGSIDGTFDADVAITTPTLVSATAAEPVMMSLASHARVHRPAVAANDPGPARRLQPKVSVDVDEPFVLNGLPVLPKYSGRVNPTGTVLVGVDHMRYFDDPDPTFDSVSDTWLNYPGDLPVGVGFVRWTVKDLPDPEPSVVAGGGRARPIVDDTLSHGYLLGDRSAVDGTDDYPGGCENWPAGAGNSFSPSWRSAYPFKPMVKEHVHLGQDGSTHTQTKGVHFRPSHVAHMWADLGTFLEPPYTVMMVAVIKDFRHRTTMNWLLDSGTDPTDNVSDGKRQKWIDNGVTGDVALDDEDFGYRLGMRVKRERMQVFTDQNPTTRIGHAPFAHKFKPKLFFMVVNGADSFFGNLGASDASSAIRSVHLADHGAQRFAVMGRRNGILSPDHALSAVVFEIRMLDTALDLADIEMHYNQLSSTWRFHDYH